MRRVRRSLKSWTSQATFGSLASDTAGSLASFASPLAGGDESFVAAAAVGTNGPIEHVYRNGSFDALIQNCVQLMSRIERRRASTGRANGQFDQSISAPGFQKSLLITEAVTVTAEM